jgi:hypothetical protein
MTTAMLDPNLLGFWGALCSKSLACTPTVGRACKKMLSDSKSARVCLSFFVSGFGSGAY